MNNVENTVICGIDSHKGVPIVCGGRCVKLGGCGKFIFWPGSVDKIIDITPPVDLTSEELDSNLPVNQHTSNKGAQMKCTMTIEQLTVIALENPKGMTPEQLNLQNKAISKLEDRIRVTAPMDR